MQILSGKTASSFYLDQIKQEVAHWIADGNRPPHLTAILVGNDGASETYVASKQRHCDKVGIKSTLIRFPETVSQQTLISAIEDINNDPAIDGLIVQMPLPKHIDSDVITHTINFKKDVDGFHPMNVGRMIQGLPTFLPATPGGILNILDFYNIETNGKHVVVLGRSNIVGTPIANLLSKNQKIGNATVTLCHSKTKDISQYIKQADILIAAVGIPHYVSASHLKKGCVIIDVGITRVPSTENDKGYVIRGDVNPKGLSEVALAASPVPGGIGLMTINMLLNNTVKAAKKAIYTDL